MSHFHFIYRHFLISFKILWIINTCKIRRLAKITHVICNLIWCTYEFPSILSPPSDGCRCVSWFALAVISCLPATQLLQSIHYKDRNFVAKEYYSCIDFLVTCTSIFCYLDFLEDFSCWFFCTEGCFLTGWFF